VPPAWPEPAAPIAAEAPRDDRIQQPTWQIFAPDAAPAVGRPLDATLPPVAPSQPPAAASADPQWPVRPDQAESPAMALLANRSNRSPSEALWAASAQEVLARPANAPAAAVVAGVQPCSSCGLSLSATARVCRRCGTRQA
jgi:ribosomal protein L40E